MGCVVTARHCGRSTAVEKRRAGQAHTNVPAAGLAPARDTQQAGTWGGARRVVAVANRLHAVRAFQPGVACPLESRAVGAEHLLKLRHRRWSRQVGAAAVAACGCSGGRMWVLSAVPQSTLSPAQKQLLCPNPHQLISIDVLAGCSDTGGPRRGGGGWAWRAARVRKLRPRAVPARQQLRCPGLPPQGSPIDGMALGAGWISGGGRPAQPNSSSSQRASSAATTAAAHSPAASATYTMASAARRGPQRRPIFSRGGWGARRPGGARRGFKVTSNATREEWEMMAGRGGVPGLGGGGACGTTCALTLCESPSLQVLARHPIQLTHNPN